MVALPPAGDIGGQDGGKSAFDAALPRSGHGAPLWGGILHRTTAGVDGSLGWRPLRAAWPTRVSWAHPLGSREVGLWHIATFPDGRRKAGIGL